MEFPTEKKFVQGLHSHHLLNIDSFKVCCFFFILKYPKLHKVVSRLFFLEHLETKAMFLVLLASQCVPVARFGLPTGDTDPGPMSATAPEVAESSHHPARAGARPAHGLGPHGLCEESQGQLFSTPIHIPGQTP